MRTFHLFLLATLLGVTISVCYPNLVAIIRIPQWRSREFCVFLRRKVLDRNMLELRYATCSISPRKSLSLDIQYNTVQPFTLAFQCLWQIRRLHHTCNDPTERGSKRRWEPTKFPSGMPPNAFLPSLQRLSGGIGGHGAQPPMTRLLPLLR